MCKCTPNIRTPFCGRGDCVWPGSKPEGAREQVPSKDVMHSNRLVAMRTVATNLRNEGETSRADCVTELCDEIERLQVIEKLYNEQCDAGYARGSILDSAHEPGSDAPVGWRYEINGEYVAFSESKPPSDAYDEGTLQPLYARPAQPPGVCRHERTQSQDSNPPHIWCEDCGATL